MRSFRFERPSNMKLPILGIILVSLLLIMLLAFIYAYIQNKNNTQYLGYIGEQKLLSQRIATSALEAASGKDEAFVALRTFRARYQLSLDFMKDGNPDTGLPSLDDDLT